MLLDIRKIFVNSAEGVDKKIKIDLRECDFAEYKVTSLVDVDVLAVLQGNLIKLDLSTTASVMAQCARCLDEFETQILLERTFFIKEGEWLQDDMDGNNLPFTKQGHLDMDILIYWELALEMPDAMVCKEDCLGICYTCGKRMPCDCKSEEENTIDERLLPLQKLLE